MFFSCVELVICMKWEEQEKFDLFVTFAVLLQVIHALNGLLENLLELDPFFVGSTLVLDYGISNISKALPLRFVCRSTFEILSAFILLVVRLRAAAMSCHLVK